jgi:hypothetical protein
MSDSLFDADRDSGLYPPKGWGWKTTSVQRDKLQIHFDMGGEVLPWMRNEAERLGITLPWRPLTASQPNSGRAE